MANKRLPEAPRVKKPRGIADDDFETLVENSELLGIRTVKVHGERLSDDDASHAENMRIRITPNIKRRGDLFDCRYNFETRIFAPDDKPLAVIDIDLVATFEFATRAKVTAELVQRFVKEVGYFVVFPYAREGIESIGTRLGIGTITLGILQQAGEKPISASFVPASERRLAAEPVVGRG
ncbi:hypothetical protein [Allorhizocola rhizosphaerae]|uniref:hypothetical protein n=1 Tax=Allorhizocola rhizosphaerae TaxID=1872709 RepID=UPI000E3EDC3D|nr:hypothetical protein [Allorhizocola rhizosphaerae]